MGVPQPPVIHLCAGLCLWADREHFALTDVVCKGFETDELTLQEPRSAIYHRE